MKNRTRILFLLTISVLLANVPARDTAAQDCRPQTRDYTEEPSCLCPPCRPKVCGFIPKPERDTSSGNLAHLLWETFVALNWPADTKAGRGVPKDPGSRSQFSATRGDAPVVWETWKQSWELFQEHPTSWNSYAVSDPPCDVVEASDGKRTPVTQKNWPRLYKKYGGTVLDGINQDKFNFGHRKDPEKLPFALAGPLIDVNSNYVRSEIRFNKVLYDCARDGEGRGCKKRPHSITMPAANKEQDGAIHVRASWRKASAADNLEGYHYRNLLVLDSEGENPPKKVCRQETRVLVGMNFAYKDEFIFTEKSGQNQWLWTAFEHHRNVPLCAESPYSFSPRRGYSYEPAPLRLDEPLPSHHQRRPVMVCRITPPPEVTSGCVNKLYRPVLPLPWNDYFQVRNQWLVTGQPNTTKRVANTTLETYAQPDTCMKCHRKQARAWDFVWSLTLFELYSDTPDASMLGFATLRH